MLPLILVIGVVWYLSQQSTPKSITDTARPPAPLTPDNSTPGFLPGTQESWWNSNNAPPPLIDGSFTNVTQAPVVSSAIIGTVAPTPTMQAAAQPQAFSSIAALRVNQPTSTPSVGLLAQKRAFTM